MGSYFYDNYDEDDYLDDNYDDLHEIFMKYSQIASWTDIYGSCVLPSILQISRYVIPFLVANIVLCIVAKLKTRLFPSYNFIMHILSFGSGSYLLYHYLDGGYIYLVHLVVTTYLLLRISFIDQHYIRFDYTISSYAILCLIVGELHEKDPKLWHHIRGVLMIIVMKVISLAFDMKTEQSLRKHFTMLAFLGYVCCPANCIFGPWTSFSEHLTTLTKAKKRFKVNINYFLQLVLNLVLSMSCLVFSNCVEVLFVPAYYWKWVTAYGSAFAFRMSHYFVSFLSQATMVSAGFKTKKVNAIQKSTENYLGYNVVHPLSIELPRSILHVVVAWNVPMHHFLKRYVFRPLKPHGTFVAVLLTYVVSSLLHGLNFQLWATLLTLGLWSYVEYNIRKKLAQAFSACVLVSRCQEPCVNHVIGRKRPLSILINSIFFCLTVTNLIYLGMIFDTNSQLQTEGFSMKHTISKWQRLNFVSHLLLVAGFLFNLVI
ncbi:protein-serine O-palmitoleoyltransferase porcupine [Toxorhynchites rutilus septentrionalis]|uniref:protein-serine O-palmitoleoyltransferase porcupine n=1 Tax=Toxorhynchites rutilus septentrionalis TaxID=329112 RepID=UPI00247AA614|nr:protein-serine O-palmitoleoyltransferase porcupine [Toxorhynchites rutilus septentrionalis]